LFPLIEVYIHRYLCKYIHRYPIGVLKKTMTTTAASNNMIPDRIVAAIRGAFVADAASMGTHWMYDPKEVKQVLSSSLDAPEFKDPPTLQFYSAAEFPGHYQVGMLSPFGEQLMFVTEYIATSMSQKASKSVQHNKEPVSGAAMSHAMVQWATTFGGRCDHATTVFLDHMKQEDKSGQWPNCGADDDQGNPA
jgi:hypothetical protein